MIKKKIFKLIKNQIIQEYFYRIFFINIFSLFFLYDTDTFNQGLISVQSLIYAINANLTIIFIFIEFVISIFQFYAFNLNFLKLIFYDFKSINLNYVYEIFLNIYRYIFYIIILTLIILYQNTIVKNFLKKKLIFYFIFLIFIGLLINFNFTNKMINKISNLNKSINKYSLLRNDNWFLYYNYYKVIKNVKKNYKDTNYLKDFSNLINFNLHDNIFIVINESYPNFKNEKIKNNLLEKIINKKSLESHLIDNYKTNWSKNYSTQGAELKLFCGSEFNFNEFKKDDLNTFITNHDCYFDKFKEIHKIFVHSYKGNYFNRHRYNTYFNETFFFNDLSKKKIDICEGRPFTAYCDHQLINKIKELKQKDKNLIIFLTINNHVPVKLIKNLNENYCESNYPLNINDQFCYLYQNQLLFNNNLEKFIKNMDKKDFLIFYSDTPPIFPAKHRIHFEDYIDVFTFKKK